MPGGFEVTLRDVYDRVLAIDEKLTELAVHRAQVDGRLDSGQQKLDDYEARIRGVERFQWKLAGMAVLASLAVSLVAAWMGHAGGHP